MVYGTTTAAAPTVSIGGISFASNNRIKDCYNSLDLSTSASFAGGIVANASGGVITNCINEAAIVSKTAAGGIVGNTTSITVLNSTNYGVVSSAAAGGILGSGVHTLIFSGNKNYGTVTGSVTACGIIGGGPYVASYLEEWSRACERT